jgi:hypothetical protein
MCASITDYHPLPTHFHANKTDAVKVKMAARLRAETVMTLDWIAGGFHMECRHTVANCLKG